MKPLVVILLLTLIGSAFMLGRTGFKPDSVSSSPAPTPNPISPATIELSVDGNVQFAELKPGETVHVVIADGKITDVQLNTP